MKFHLALFFSILWANGALSADILVIDPTPSYSHFIIPFKLAKELANRGHKVTCINAHPQKRKIENYTDVSVVENIALVEEVKNKLFSRASAGILDTFTSLFDMIAGVTNNTIHHKNVQALLKSDKKFDLVIIEDFFNQAFVGFGHRFKAPVVLVSTHAANGMNNYIFANPAPSAYVPGFGGSLTKHMNFWERIKNLLMNTLFNLLTHCYHLPQQRRIFKSYMSDIELDDILYNTSLMLTNSHVSVSDANPLVPAIKEVGGLHVTPKPLPSDLQKFLDEAKEGVVLFSMGSILKSEDMKPEVRAGILKAFSKIKQKVLWKFGTEVPNTPENVKIMNWLPQADILAHQNVQAFITHGGRLGTIEAIYFGVPIIGIPVFGDQPANIATAVEDGYAVRIDLDQLNEETLSQALNEILTNPKYRENAQQRSKVMHDQPLTPMDSAVFWVEHVIRHKGAPHLKSAGLDLKWYQREMLDVHVFLISVLGIFLTVIYLVVKKLNKLIFSTKTYSTKYKKNQ